MWTYLERLDAGAEGKLFKLGMEILRLTTNKWRHVDKFCYFQFQRAYPF